MTPVQVSVTREGNRVEAKGTGATARLDVYSKRGIGSATVEYPARAWPSAIALVLHLGGLESLCFRFEQYAIDVSVASTGEYAVRESLSKIGEPGTVPVEAGSPYWMAIVRTPRPDDPRALRFDVQAPAALFEEGPCPFSFEWVDFYR